MEMFVYVFATLFILLALGLVFTYARKRHPGLLLMATAYGAAAGAAIALVEGWPLLAGFAVAWAVRLVGLDPDTARK
jgi:hypothetical protein